MRRIIAISLILLAASVPPAFAAPEEQGPEKAVTAEGQQPVQQQVAPPPVMNTVLAPEPVDPKAKNKAPVKAAKEPVVPGYIGVIAGEAAQPQSGKLIDPTQPAIEEKKQLPSLVAEPKQSKPVPPRMTPDPRAAQREQKIKDQRSLKVAAMLNGFEQRLKTEHLPKMDRETLILMTNPLVKKDGLTKTERTIQRLSIDKMKALADPKLSGEERRALAKKSYEELLSRADAIIFRNKAQQMVFGASGAPPEILQAKKEANERALDMLAQTIRSLKVAAEEQ